MAGDVVQAGGEAADLVAGEDEDDAGDQEDHDGGDLDETEPELQLTENRHADDIEGHDDDQGDQGQHPLRHRVEGRPELQVEGEGGHVGDAGDGPLQEVVPAQQIGGTLAEELTGVGDHTAGARPVHDQLTDGAQHEEAEETAHRVGDEQRRAGVMQASTGTEEQAGTDGRTDGHHLDVAVLEALLVALLVSSQKRRRRL